MGKCRVLTNEERIHVFQLMLMDFDGKKLRHGIIKRYAESFSVSTRTVSRIWKLGSVFVAKGDPVDVSNRRTKNVGRKRIEIDPEKVKLIDLRRRRTLEGLACGLGMSKTTVHRRFKEGKLRRHTNPIKPSLSEDNKKERLKFCLSMLEGNGIMDGSRFAIKFSDMYDHVVIDEKWFYLTKDVEHYYLTCDEADPQRTCQSKRFIPKVMFLTVVARPRFNELGECTFDGKIGLFPFVVKEGAKRSSKNRPVGTLETKIILSITKEVTKTWVIKKVLPTIRQKWPSSSRDSVIYIQQDNARPHVSPLDTDFIEASRVGGFDIRLKQQPPNSPDLNVLDLEFFRAIQSLYYQKAPKNVDELVSAVEKAFDELSPNTLNSVFLTQQQVMLEILQTNSKNKFNIPHMKKAKIERGGCLPVSLSCDFRIVELANTWMARRLESLSL